MKPWQLNLVLNNKGKLLTMTYAIIVSPCPFCPDGGRPFPYYNQRDVLSYVVQCRSCGSQGPHAKIDMDAYNEVSRSVSWTDFVEQYVTESIKCWNNRHNKDDSSVD